MFPENPHIRKYLRKFRRFAEDLHNYVKLSFQEEQIQRMTDFKSCKRPVLLIYGFGTTRRIFTILEKRLRKDGYCVFSVHLGGFLDTFNTGGIIKSAELIQQKINKLKKLYDLGPISIIGYSKGGLIGSYYIKNLDGADKVCNLITLGAPHYGTPWAFLGIISPLVLFSKSLRQMWPLSPFIRKLNAKKIPQHINFVSIYSRGDAICPYPSCKIDTNGKENYKNIELKDLTHSQFVISRRAYEVVKNELEVGLQGLIQKNQINQKEKTIENKFEIIKENSMEEDSEGTPEIDDLLTPATS